MTTIGYYSASTAASVITPQRFARAKKYLQMKEYTLVAGALTGKQDHYRSGSIKERVAEINGLIHDENIDIIMAITGGTNTGSVIPYLDYEYLREHPKKFIGFSDSTALLMAVLAQTDSEVYHGPGLVSGFGEFAPFVDETFKYFESAINADEAHVSIKIPKFWSDDSVNKEVWERNKEQHTNKLEWIDSTELKGRLIGGNLNTIIGSVWGSPYMPEIQQGDILFIEDSKLDAAWVERNFAFLNANGIFKKISGVLLGKHALYDDRGTGRKPIDILLEVLGDTKLPIIYNFDSSHTVPIMTIPIGKEVVINAESGDIVI